MLKKNFVKPGQGYFWRDGKWYTYRGIDFSNAMDKFLSGEYQWDPKKIGILSFNSISLMIERALET